MRGSSSAARKRARRALRTRRNLRHRGTLLVGASALDSGVDARRVSVVLTVRSVPSPVAGGCMQVAPLAGDPACTHSQDLLAVCVLHLHRGQVTRGVLQRGDSQSPVQVTAVFALDRGETRFVVQSSCRGAAAPVPHGDASAGRVPSRSKGRLPSGPHRAKPHYQLARIALLAGEHQLDGEAFVVARDAGCADPHGVRLRADDPCGRAHDAPFRTRAEPVGRVAREADRPLGLGRQPVRRDEDRRRRSRRPRAAGRACRCRRGEGERGEKQQRERAQRPRKPFGGAAPCLGSGCTTVSVGPPASVRFLLLGVDPEGAWRSVALGRVER